MQERMQKAQDDLAKIEVTGEAGAGMVKVTMTCNHNVRRVDIDESLMDDDKDMVEIWLLQHLTTRYVEFKKLAKRRWVM